MTMTRKKRRLLSESDVFTCMASVSFCFAHRLYNYTGACHNLHGHNAIAEIEIETSVLDDSGMTIDFGDVKDEVGRIVGKRWDHALVLWDGDPLCDVLSDHRMYRLQYEPTTENMAKALYYMIATANLHLQDVIKSVTLWETPKQWAKYSVK